MPFRLRSHAGALALACTVCLAVPGHAAPPPLMAPQIERLVALLGDSYAKGYPQAAMVQAVSLPDGRKLAVAVFTIEAYGGGNNHRQYLALFEDEADESGPRDHYLLLDVMQIGAKGWRAIPQLQVETRVDASSGKLQFLIPALANLPGDALNFPSKKTLIRLTFDRRLTEVAEAGR